MPNCDFFAAGMDHRRVLEFVFMQDCRVYELCSNDDQPLHEFTSLEDLETHCGISNWRAERQESILLQLHADKGGGALIAKRIDFRSSPSGARFRYDACGWGLIQLYLESPRDRWLRESHTSHNTEKRALAWADVHSELGPVSAWRWKEIASFSRRINRFIHKQSVGKVGSRCVLPEAAQLHRDGLSLGPGRLQNVMQVEEQQPARAEHPLPAGADKDARR